MARPVFWCDETEISIKTRRTYNLGNEMLSCEDVSKDESVNIAKQESETCKSELSYQMQRYYFLSSFQLLENAILGTTLGAKRS